MVVKLNVGKNNRVNYKIKLARIKTTYYRVLHDGISISGWFRTDQIIRIDWKIVVYIILLLNNND